MTSTHLTRRQFLHTAVAAGAFTLARPFAGWAATDPAYQIGCYPDLADWKRNTTIFGAKTR